MIWKLNRQAFMIQRLSIECLICLIACCSPKFISAANSINNKSLVNTDSAFSFVVGGHFYGSAKVNNFTPAATLMANLDHLNSQNPAFFLSIGDLFLNLETDLDNYHKTFFSKLEVPLFNAVGNHDISNRELYEEKFGKTFFSFSIRNNLFIVLDTEINDGAIKGEQYLFFKSLAAEKFKTAKNIFIFTHRPIWTNDTEQLGAIFKGNNKSPQSDFTNSIKPLLKISKPVYWFSGSLGQSTCSFFYHQESPFIYYIQSAIRDKYFDGILSVEIDKKDKVKFRTISLTGHNLNKLESFDINFWKKKSSINEPFNFKLVLLQTKQTFSHRYFWYGISITLFAISLFKIKFFAGVSKKI